MAARSSSGGGLPVAQGAMVGAAVWIVSAILMFVVGQALGGGMAFIMAFNPLLAIMIFMLMFNAGGIVMGGGLIMAGSGLVYLLIPIFGAVIGGYVVANGTAGDGLQSGASVAVGFFVLQILAMLLVFLMAGGGGGTGGMTGMTQLIVGLVVGGLIQPAIFGAIGGAFAG